MMRVHLLWGTSMSSPHGVTAPHSTAVKERLLTLADAAYTTNIARNGVNPLHLNFLSLYMV